MYKIVLTGGPCAGKTEILAHLIRILEERGYKVIIVPEMATELIMSGICPSNAISMENFQNFILDLQLAKENIFTNVEQYYDSNKVVVFFDRGVLDACAYVDKDKVFAGMLKARGFTFEDIYQRYDAVLHLVTAADGAEAFYKWNDPTKEDVGNNAARSESPAEAREKDKKTLNSWIGHPHLKVIDNSTDFEGKINRVVAEVFSLIGEPIPKTFQRKFLIKQPTLLNLTEVGFISQIPMVQTYLKSDNLSERRIRQRGSLETGYSFYYTEKQDFENGIRQYKEKKISSAEYIERLAEADTTLHQLSKTRYSFIFNKQYFVLDVYPFSNEYAILEIELSDPDENISLPPFEVVKEVTHDKMFRNYELAKSLTFQV